MGFCGWPVTPPGGDEWAALDLPVRERATALAGRVLWTLTGRRYGLCEATARPRFEPTGGTTYRGNVGFWPGLTLDPCSPRERG